MQDAPGDDQVQDQSALQPLQGAQLQRLDPAARFPNPEKNFHQPAATIPINQFHDRLEVVSAVRLVSNRHTIAFSPAGGRSSRARIAVTVTAGWP